MLTFPNLAASDFEPWVDAGDAARKGVSVAEFAAKTAETWKNGLAEWDQAPERIAQLQGRRRRGHLHAGRRDRHAAVGAALLLAHPRPSC